MMRYVVTTAVAWLGLAGLVDGLVVWQTWFEVGVMEHWRSVKTWIIAVLFDWLPFNFPSALLDYLVIGLLFWRPMNRLEYYVPLRGDQMNWFYYGLNISITFVGVLIIVLLLWPLQAISLIFYLYRRMRRELDFDDHIAYATLLSFVGFVPFLFIVSSVLYEYG